MLGEIASGFLKKVGADVYDAVKATLKRIFSKPKQSAQERLLVFRIAFEDGDVAGVAEVIMTDPSPQEIDTFLTEGLAQLSASISNDFAAERGLRKLTYEYRDQVLNLLFAVRRDAVPLCVRCIDRQRDG